MICKICENFLRLYNIHIIYIITIIIISGETFKSLRLLFSELDLSDLFKTGLTLFRYFWMVLVKMLEKLSKLLTFILQKHMFEQLNFFMYFSLELCSEVKKSAYGVWKYPFF